MFQLKNESYIQLATAALFTISVLCGGYTADNGGFTAKQVEEAQTFDLFSDKAKNDVQPMMEKALENPTERNLKKVNNHLYIGVQNWVDRHEDENKEIFQEYLNECESVIDDTQAGKQVDTTEMYRLYYLLVPDEKTTKQNIEVNSPYLWTAAVPSN